MDSTKALDYMQRMLEDRQFMDLPREERMAIVNSLQYIHTRRMKERRNATAQIRSHRVVKD